MQWSEIILFASEQLTIYVYVKTLRYNIKYNTQLLRGTIFLTRVLLYGAYLYNIIIINRNDLWGTKKKTFGQTYNITMCAYVQDSNN